MFKNKLLIISILVLLLLPSFVYAIDIPGWPLVPCGLSQDNPATPFNEKKLCGRCDLFQLLKNLIDFVIGGLMPPMAVLLFVWAGFLILLSGANPGLYAQGQTIFKNTFYGIVVLLSAWMITNTLILSIGANYNNAGNWWQFTCTEPALVTPPVVTPPVVTPPQKYSCNQNNQCVADPTGTYTTSNCGNTCQPIEAVKYDCNTQNQCVRTPNGRFTSPTCNEFCRPPPGGSLSIVTNNFPNGTIGQPYSQTIQVSGGAAPYGWTVVGSPPAGLTFNTFTGVVSGTPTTTGTSNFTITVVDQSSPQQSTTKQFTLTVTGSTTSTPSITTSSLPGGTVGQSYRQQLQVQGGSQPYRFIVSTGSLPAGLTLNLAGGDISGTPTTAGTSTFTVRVTDNSSPQQSTTKQLSIVVGGATLTCGQPWEQSLCQPRQMTCSASACSQYASAINQYASRTGVANGANFLKAIMVKESACNVGVQSGSVPPSCGLMQLKASTANIYKSRCNITADITCAWLKSSANANASICIAAEYMKAVTQTSCGSTPRGVAAGYNGGSGACSQSRDCSSQTSCAGGPTQRWECLYDNPQQTVCNTGYVETRDYATKVLYCYNNPGF